MKVDGAMPMCIALYMDQIISEQWMMDDGVGGLSRTLTGSPLDEMDHSLLQHRTYELRTRSTRTKKARFR